MSMKFIRDTYGVPAKRGGKIMFQGHEWTIISSQGSHLVVRRTEVLWEKDEAGEFRYRFFRAEIHPTWEVEYLPE